MTESVLAGLSNLRKMLLRFPVCGAELLHRRPGREHVREFAGFDNPAHRPILIQQFDLGADAQLVLPGVVLVHDHVAVSPERPAAPGVVEPAAHARELVDVDAG